MNAALRARLDELRQLLDGWFHGRGVAPGNDFLDWMRDTFAAQYPAHFIPCEVIPIVEGGLRANWFGPAGALAADVYFRPDQYACLYAVTLVTVDRPLVIGEMDLAGDWREVFSFVPAICLHGGLLP